MCEAAAPVPLVPSPKSHAKDAMEPSGSVEAEPSTSTTTPAVAATSTPATASGGRFLTTLTGSLPQAERATTTAAERKRTMSAVSRAKRRASIQSDVTDRELAGRVVVARVRRRHRERRARLGRFALLERLPVDG